MIARNINLFGYLLADKKNVKEYVKNHNDERMQANEFLSKINLYRTIVVSAMH